MGGGEVEDAEEGCGSLLVVGGDRTPFLLPGPEALDADAIGVDRRCAGDWRLVDVHWDGKLGVEVERCWRKPWPLYPRSAKTQIGTPREQRDRVGQFVRLTGARGKATALPTLSAITQAVVKYPPRGGLSPSPALRCAGAWAFGRPLSAFGARGSRYRRF